MRGCLQGALSFPFPPYLHFGRRAHRDLRHHIEHCAACTAGPGGGVHEGHVVPRGEHAAAALAAAAAGCRSEKEAEIERAVGAVRRRRRRHRGAAAAAVVRGWWNAGGSQAGGGNRPRYSDVAVKNSTRTHARPQRRPHALPCVASPRPCSHTPGGGGGGEGDDGLGPGDVAAELVGVLVVVAHDVPSRLRRWTARQKAATGNRQMRGSQSNPNRWLQATGEFRVGSRLVSGL